MADVFGEEVWVSSSDITDDSTDDQQYVVDPADPLAGEVWVQTDLTEEYVDDPGEPGYGEA
jgi:hypothetical protein